MLAQLRRSVSRWLRERGASNQDVTEIVLAVNEACANAIEHAYSPAPAEFLVDASVREREVTIVVTDSGRWRSPRGSDRGRGLAVIDAAMDEVEVNSAATGTEIVMRRRLVG